MLAVLPREPSFVFGERLISLELVNLFFRSFTLGVCGSSESEDSSNDNNTKNFVNFEVIDF